MRRPIEQSGGKVAFCGMMTALALLVGYVEAVLPITLGITGAKLGLTNIVVVILLYCYGWKAAAGVSAMRILLAGFLFGNLAAIMYSLAGAAFSLTCMAWLKKTERFSMRGVSVAGGVCHNLGQLIVASCVVENLMLFYYFPALCIAGVLTGYLVGLLSQSVYGRIAGLLGKDS